MTTIAVLGHCQADVMADCLKILAPRATVEPWTILAPVVAGSDEHQRRLADLERADVVLTQMMGDKATTYGVPQPGDLVRPDCKVLTWPIIAFKGFQPDCTYIFQGGEALAGSVGPYHSAIAVAGFLERLDVRRTLGLYNALSYGALGYFDEFALGAEVLARSAAASGLNVSEFLDRPQSCFTHTFNHPKVGIVHSMAKQLLRRAGIEPADTAAPLTDRLAAGPVWPVYPDIARRIGIEGSMEFSDGDRHMDLATAVQGTFDTMDKYEQSVGPIVLDQDRPMATPIIERAQAFIRAHVIK